MVDYYSCKMSGSDEEFEPQMQTGMSKAELRRSNKPIMEKRRRARINQCLDELKSLILEAMKKDPTRHSKLEKADILEMTVKHLQSMQRQQISTAVSTDPAVLTKFRSGFSECASEVSRYVNHLENVDPTVKTRLTSHLSNCMNNLQQSSPFYNHYVPYMPERLYPEVKVGFQSDAHSLGGGGGGGGGGGDENNNNGTGRIQIPSNVQLIPSRLANGELALLVPPTANFPGFFPPTTTTTAGAGPDASAAPRLGQPSAFTAVHRSHSPLLSPSTSTSSFDDTQPGCLSPAGHFKLAERSATPKGFPSPPDTQKPQISSSSDPSSPGPGSDGPDSYSLRQPLSVITDKYNRGAAEPARREHGLKRHHQPDGLLLAISDKRPRYQEPASTSCPLPAASSTSSAASSSSSSSSSSSCLSPTVKIKQEYQSPQDDVAAAADKATGVETSTTTSTTNGDMWRPW